MVCKKIACALSLAAAFAFVACDDESTSFSPKTEGDEQELSSDSKDVDGSSESKDVNGDDGKAVSSSSVAGGFDVDEMKCDEEGAKKTESYMGQEIPLVCEEGFWMPDEEAMDEMYTCDEEGATKTDTITMGNNSMQVAYVCVDGEWEVDSAATAKCDKEGDEMEVDFGGMVMKATCVNGTWVPDEGAMEEQFVCTAEEEGKTKEIMGMPFVCTDGEYMPDMDFDFGDLPVDTLGVVKD